MPLLGEGHSDFVRDEAPYFRSLAELDTWFAQPHDKLSGVVPYQPRPQVDGQSDSIGKLLVCHDYKGGYTESPSGLCYTFNFWRLCDTFVYFSHHRVTVPPSGWTNTAHKQGTKMLGTLIFEGNGNPDCLQIIVGYADFAVTGKNIPISKRYAVLLAELAYQRGFDGYLLNFESDLPYETDHARALAAWILLLKAELRVKVGPHAQVMWYDSVMYNGRLKYQNRLNGYNLPFFLAADTLFTNYWWKPETQDSMAQYVANLKRAVPGSNASTDAPSFVPDKALQDIYSGVDVWPGRGQYGDSGFSCYRSITYTSPRGFSTALFAPGWTWEAATENPEQNWNEWWDNERKFWLGPLNLENFTPIPDSPEGPFKPMAAFFQDLPPPDPLSSVFYTNFSPGVSYSWFVEGKKVMDTKKGWSDIDKQSSIGNLVWPRPTPSRQDAEQEEAVPTATTVLDMTDGYNGGNTLTLTITCPGSESEGTIWLPVQSLTLTTRESLEARVVYKATAPNDVSLRSHIDVKSLSNEEDDSRVLAIGQTTVKDLPHGWTSQTINFTATSTKNTMSVAMGFLIDVVRTDSLANVTFSLSLGQLAVYPIPPPQSVSVGTPSITGAKFAPSAHALNTNADALEGVLTWDTTSTFTPIDSDVQIDDPESITPAWLLQDTPASRFPTFAYFNIYTVPLHDAAAAAHADTGSTVFIGTTGLDGRANRFYVEPACLPRGWDTWDGAKFYVQGVTDRGEVLPWESCATVVHKKYEKSST
ncbi:glycoside hydrolase family 85 protein [Boletus reticuloceps]|uniref:Glycoside hydrolase family 85 protein n=1 Tax=Boletus reticuloceps TaxID=495285 RepID=A0A8I3A9P6_9AGAM|nr:glycoside hydrolase family 85 protein [Boletus reticuloceps]